MDNITKIVMIYNQFIKNELINKKFARNSVFGICEPMTNKKKTVPAFYNKEEAKPIVIDVTSDIWIYHKIKSSTYRTLQTKSFARTNVVEQTTNMKLIAAFNRKLSLTQMDIEQLITAALNQKISREELIKTNFKSITINVANTSYDRSAIYRSEWGISESELHSNFQLLEIDYRVTCTYNSVCAINICCN